MSIVIEELLPFGYLNVNAFFSILGHNLVSNRWNFIKLIPSIYDHSVIMHV